MSTDSDLRAVGYQGFLLAGPHLIRKSFIPRAVERAEKIMRLTPVVIHKAAQRKSLRMEEQKTLNHMRLWHPDIVSEFSFNLHSPEGHDLLESVFWGNRESRKFFDEQTERFVNWWNSGCVSADAREGLHRVGNSTLRVAFVGGVPCPNEDEPSTYGYRLAYWAGATGVGSALLVKNLTRVPEGKHCW